MNKSKGTIYILISAVFFASYGLWSKMMVEGFGVFSQAWTRGLILLVAVTLIGSILKLWKKVERKDWKWFVFIALAGGLNQAPYFFGFKYLEIGTATMIFYASLVAGGFILGKFFFSEKLGISKITSLIVSIIGMLVIYGFVLTQEQIIPALFTTIAGLMGSITVILPKKLVGEYHELQIMSGYFIMQVVVNLPLALLLKETMPSIDSKAWLGQLAYAVSMIIANFSAIKGFSYLEASVGSLLGLTEIVFGIVLGVLLLNEIVTPEKIIGATIILISAALPDIINIIKDRRSKIVK